MALMSLESGFGSASGQIVRMSGSPSVVLGETIAKFPLRNLFGWPNFNMMI